MRRALIVVLAVLIPFGLQMRGDAARYNGWRQSATFTPVHRVVLKLRTTWSGDVSLKLYAIPRSQTIALAMSRRYLFPAQLVPGRIVKSVLDPAANRHAVTGRIAGYQDENGFEHSVDFGILPIGSYAALWEAGDERGIETVDVSSVGMYVFDDASRGLVAFAVDLGTMHARNDVAFSLYRETATTPIKPDRDGLVHVPEKHLRSSALVAQVADGSIAVASVGNSAGNDYPSDRETVIVRTDRPLYRAGQVVHFQAIFRVGEVGAYRVPIGTRSIELHDSRGKSTERKNLKLDEFGSMSGDFQLPEDGPLGFYRLDTEQEYWAGGFSVEAYRRPEYEITFDRSAAHVIGGEPANFRAGVRYFFGRPAGGMKLNYQTRVSNNSLYRSYRADVTIERSGVPTPTPNETLPPPFAGVTQADPDGRVAVVVPTSPTEEERTLAFSLDAKDESGHTVTASSRVLITPASFYLRVRPRSYFVDAGKMNELMVTSSDYEGTPRPGIETALSFASLTYDAFDEKWKRTPIAGSEQSIRTGTDGTAVALWHAPAEGWFEVTAVARDEAGRRTWARHDFWVFAPTIRPKAHFEFARIVPQREQYPPGEPATLLLTAPRANVDALVIVKAGATRTMQIVRLTSLVSSVRVQPPPDAASYQVSVVLPTETSMTSANALVQVDPPPRRLHLEVVPDREKYEPGSPAHFSIVARDYRGRPLRAQVAIGIVDDALYALRRNYRGNLFARLYPREYLGSYPEITWSGLNNPNDIIIGGNKTLVTIGRITTRNADASFQPGTTADVYTVNPTFDDIRKDFRETAFWSPNVVTGADGRAVVSFNWPDSLTSYTTDASAITVATDAGEATASSLVTRDFLVRLETPRFLRVGDRAEIIGVAQGRAGAAGAALRFAAPAFGVPDARSDVAFDRYATGSAFWDVEAKSLGSSPVRLAGASEQLRDAMELPLAVERAATTEHVRGAGKFPEAARVALGLPAGYQSGDLHLDLSPSIVGELLQGFKLLQVYPYECTEQTMSSALPAAYIGRLAKRLGLPAQTVSADDVAERAVARLKQLQHSDGSWGWWEHDGAHPFMTAYALYGLAELRDAGYYVDQWDIQRGRDSLLAQLKDESAETLVAWGDRNGTQWNERAFMLFAVAKAMGKETDREIFRDADAHLDALKPYGLAVLGLAHHFAEDDASARTALRRLEATVVQEGDFVHWQGDSWRYRWEDDPIEATAYALRLLVALSPDSPRIPKAVAWLQSQQHGSWWYTTKDTAAAIGAISETLKPGGGEFDPHEIVRVLLEGKLVKSIRFDSPVPNRDASFVIPASLLGNGGTITLEREGSGTVYWTSDWTRYIPASRRTASDIDAEALRKFHGDSEPGLTVEREYSVARAGPWRLGDEIGVQLTVHFKRDQEYIAIEDAFPAGLEYQPLQYETGLHWSGSQFFDDRAVFFVTRASAGDTFKLRYRLRAMTAGSFTAPASTAYAMYGPPITALGSAHRVTIMRGSR